jgi:hypothetical protein
MKTVGDRNTDPIAKQESVKYKKVDQSYPMNPRQVNPGGLRGEKVITGSLTIQNEDNPDEQIIFGQFDDEFGIFGVDASDPNNFRIVWKIIGATRYIYNLDDDTNIMQDGRLPDGSYGWFVAAEGENVEDAISA